MISSNENKKLLAKSNENNWLLAEIKEIRKIASKTNMARFMVKAMQERYTADFQQFDAANAEGTSEGQIMLLLAHKKNAAGTTTFLCEADRHNDRAGKWKRWVDEEELPVEMVQDYYQKGVISIEEYESFSPKSKWAFSDSENEEEEEEEKQEEEQEQEEEGNLKT